MVKFIFFSDGREEEKNNTGLGLGLLVVIGFIILVVILRNAYAEPIDMDPDLSPSYATEFVWYTFLIPVIPQILFFTIPYIPLWLIEKYKNIPSRSLQKLFLALTALYFGGTFSFILLLGVVNLISNPSGNFGLFGSFMFTFGWIGIPVLALGIILLYKSPLIRKLLKK